MPKKPTDLNYAAWLDRPGLTPTIGNQASNIELRPAANAFLSNIERVDALGSQPFILASLGISQGLAYAFAQTQGKDTGDVLSELRAKPTWQSELSTAAKRLANQASNSTVPFPQKGFRALAASLLIDSYGALEALLAEIIVVLRELRPELKARLPKEFRNQPVGKKNLKAFRRIYEQMFPEDNEGPPHGLSREFSNNYKRLLVLEAARNLFSHQCGIVDARFVELVKTSPALMDLQQGDELVVDFEIARALAGVSLNFGIYLLQFSDWWLNTHPTIIDEGT